MLYAKINPTAIVYTQINPFSGITTIADYMTVIARPYGVGASQINFEVVYGTIDIISNKFNRLTSSNITMSESEIINWGTDDTVILSLIATKLGITASDFINIADNMMY